MSAIRHIMLTQAMFATVNVEDFETLSRFLWCVLAAKGGRRFYAVRRERNRFIFMHRVIANAPQGIDVDHINGNGLDNRRCNLRLCTRTENLRNARWRHGKSPLKGVAWHSGAKAWEAYIRLNGRKLYLGSFASEVDAAKAHDAVALKHFGEFARLNFPPP